MNVEYTAVGAFLCGAGQWSREKGRAFSSQQNFKTALNALFLSEINSS